jgi:hypothetical protein
MKRLYAYKRRIKIHTEGYPYNSLVQGTKIIHLADVDLPDLYIDEEDKSYDRAPDYDIVILDDERYA